MIEADAVRRRVSRSAPVRLSRMTDAARGEVSSICSRVRRVANVATIMRAHSVWDRQRRPSTQRRAMTSDASVLRSRGGCHVLRMIELQVEAFFEFIGKSFARRIVAVNALMTDRTHRQNGRRELRQVTTRA